MNLQTYYINMLSVIRITLPAPPPIKECRMKRNLMLNSRPIFSDQTSSRVPNISILPGGRPFLTFFVIFIYFFFDFLTEF